GALPRPREQYYGLVLLVDFIVIGASFIVYAWTPTLNWAVLMSALTGITDGYMSIVMISWIQVHTDTNALGRVMGMIMFFNIGVAPVSSAIAGALINLSLTGVFLVSGMVMIVLTLIAATIPTIRTMGIAADEGTVT
ncbi:MAG TPA: hypothetical protein VJ998_02345, partial [Pseudomonadales bacterium]|nr:hypothetical protein [Pseudomonadales bacterium]